MHKWKKSDLFIGIRWYIIGDDVVDSEHVHQMHPWCLLFNVETQWCQALYFKLPARYLSCHCWVLSLILPLPWSPVSDAMVRQVVGLLYRFLQLVRQQV